MTAGTRDAMDETADLADLLVAVARDDRAAFRQIYERASAKLFGIALRICRERGVAEDALQDTFAEIWRKAGDYDRTRGNPLAWMSAIARNRSIDAMRRRPMREQAAGGTEDYLQNVIDPASRSDGGVAYLALAACLKELDEPQREAVLRAYYRGESRDELARHFDTPVNTIKSWLRRSLAALKGCLER